MGDNWSGNRKPPDGVEFRTIACRTLDRSGVVDSTRNLILLRKVKAHEILSVASQSRSTDARNCFRHRSRDRRPSLLSRIVKSHTRRRGQFWLVSVEWLHCCCTILGRTRVEFLGTNPPYSKDRIRSATKFFLNDRNHIHGSAGKAILASFRYCSCNLRSGLLYIVEHARLPTGSRLLQRLWRQCTFDG